MKEASIRDELAIREFVARYSDAVARRAAIGVAAGR